MHYWPSAIPTFFVVLKSHAETFRWSVINHKFFFEKVAGAFFTGNESFFEGLIEFMSSGPSVVMVLEKEGVIEKYRELMGATDLKGAAKGTIRRDFASDNQKNIVHGSDSPESALMEISYFFSALELT